MRIWHSPFARGVLAALAVLIAGCAGFTARLTPGVSTLPEVVAAMGEPAMVWQDADGRQQLAYPKGPSGTETFMAFIAPDGRLERLEGVLDTPHFARIESGKSDQAAVLRLLGPSNASETAYFDRRNELVWEWRICDDSGFEAFFGVNFDATTGIARSTYKRPVIEPFARNRPRPCGKWVVPVR